jgi:hypothetical protein
MNHTYGSHISRDSTSQDRQRASTDEDNAAPEQQGYVPDFSLVFGGLIRSVRWKTSREPASLVG